MALTVENGTGLSNADSYVSLNDANAYHADYENPTAWSSASDANKEFALRVATRYLDAKYNTRWKGNRTNETQALDWPRSNVVDYDGFAIDIDALPKALTDATSMLALKQLSEDLLPDITNPGSIKREKVKVGPIEEDITYTGGKEELKRYTLVEHVLRDLIISSGSVRRA